MLTALMILFKININIKKIFLWLLMVPLYFTGKGQFNLPNPSSPSPSAISGKQSIEISNDLYNGKLDVNIPIYSYNFEGISFPINLSYIGGNGIKPDELPSWVGSGWNLQGGGYIHRTVRGKPDEALDFETIIRNTGTVAEKQTDLNATDYSYFSNPNKLNVSNWYTQTYAASISPSQVNLPISVPTGASYNHHPTYDLVPDEFTFSFGSMSGKFYFNHLNKWIVQANDGKKYTINVVTGEQTLVDFFIAQLNRRTYYKAPKIIKFITLTSSDGIRYTFGSTNLTTTIENQHFDYSHSSEVWPAPPTDFTPPKAYRSGNETATLLDIVPHTWHITKIENLKTGSVITFSYSPRIYQFYSTKQAWGPVDNIIYNNNQIIFPDPDNVSLYYRLSPISRVLTRTRTLSAINFPNGVKIEFVSTLSNQLSANESVNQAGNSGYNNFEDIYYSTPSITGQTNALVKLDKILFSYNGEVTKEMNFNYTSNSNQRLQLTGLKEKAANGEFSNEYQFQYNNSIQLPGYAAGKSDHWGFFNNKDFFESVLPPYNLSKLSSYTSYRNPDAAYSQAGILKKIVYPTGGSVVFDYEPNQYSQKRSLTNFVITNLGYNEDAGGVRIKRASYYSEDNNLKYEKIYEYTIPGAATLSSGVLSSPAPSYISGNSTLYYFAATGYNPLNYEGNHVTYTYASERQGNNGKTEYEYTNYNNGFNDVAPIETNAGGFTSWGFDHAYVHNAFKRGKVKSIIVKNETGSVIKESSFHYEHENSEANKDELRSLYLGVFTSPNYYASISERIYPDHTILQQEKTFTSNGILSVSSNTLFDEYGNIKEITSLDSKGQRVREKFKYCYEYLSVGTDNASLGIKFLNDLGIKTALIEKITFKENSDGTNSNIIKASLNVYNPNSSFIDNIYVLETSNGISPSLFIESTISGNSFIKDSRYSVLPDAQIQNYDSKGNVLQYQARDGVVTSFQRGNNDLYPETKIINAQNSYKINYVPLVQNSQILIPAGTFQDVSYSFNQYYLGDIPLDLIFTSTPNSSSVIRVLCTLTPGNYTQYLCIRTTSGCSYPFSGIFSSVPAGVYTLTVSILENTSSPGTRVRFSYNDRLPSPTGIKEFFYQGFEETNGASITTPYAGKKYFSGDYQVPFIKPNNRNYKVNYHYLELGKWKNITKDYSNNMTLFEGDAIDEVRVYPFDAFITTYTHTPLIGITSETDANGKTIFYEYDNFQRLKLIRDQDGNIVKKFCYNYAGKPENCDISTAPQWLRTGSSRCIGGIGEYEYIDVNPYSGSHNTIQWFSNGIPCA